MNKQKLVLIGGGGHCKSVLDAIKQSNGYSDVVITDSSIPAGNVILGYSVVGDDSMLPRLKDQGFTDAFISVGSINNTNIRRKIADEIARLDFRVPIIIDPSAIVSASAKICEGSFIGKKAIINADAFIGKYCIINTGSIIEHECGIGDFTHVSVGAILCGNVKVGTDCFIGAGSTIIQGITVNDRSVIGAGAVVNRSTPSDCTVVGVPASIIRIKGQDGDK